MRDLSIFKKFNFELPPVGIKYLLNRPKGIKKLDKKLALCEMPPEAQKGEAFYATAEDFECVGPLILGMVEPDAVFESGQVGARLGVFKEARANRRVYPSVPTLANGSVRYVVFSPLDKLTFDPDVLILTANSDQAEILLRAYAYTTGKMWNAKGTVVIGCAWLFIYPYVTGELNFTITNIGAGMKARRVLPEGLVLLALPYDLIPMMVENLQELEWVPPDYIGGRDEHSKIFEEVVEVVMKEYQEDR